jgi:hypothetical protein
VGFLVDLALVSACVLALGLVVGVVWPQLVDPPLAERTAQGISTSEVQLGRAFAVDGWFVVLGFAGSLVLGALLMLRRRGHEVVVLLLLLGGTYLAADQVAAPLGISLGPADPVKVLTHAKVGDTAPSRLCTVVRTDDGPRCVLSSRSDALSWPFGAAVGALVVLLSVSRLERDRAERSSADDRSAVAAAD